MISAGSLDQINAHIQDNKMALLYFSRPECGVCKALKPKVEQVIHEEFSRIKMMSIDLDTLAEAAGIYSVFTIPAILLYVEGKETLREARYLSISDFTQKVDRYYSLLFE